jgi:metal-responsive CopG/Arc/MetJ family transcriptional regulator
MQTMVQLNDTLLEVLDQRATATGRSRSDLIREAIEQHYKEDIEAAIDRAMVAGYTRVPDDDEFEGLAEASIQVLNTEDPW